MRADWEAQIAEARHNRGVDRAPSARSIRNPKAAEGETVRGDARETVRVSQLQPW